EAVNQVEHLPWTAGDIMERCICSKGLVALQRAGYDFVGPEKGIAQDDGWPGRDLGDFYRIVDIRDHGQPLRLYHYYPSGGFGTLAPRDHGQPTRACFILSQQALNFPGW